MLTQTTLMLPGLQNHYNQPQPEQSNRSCLVNHREWIVQRAEKYHPKPEPDQSAKRQTPNSGTEAHRSQHPSMILNVICY